MENLTVSTLVSKNSEEKAGVDQLQAALYIHKQHIAVEVKNVLGTELSALVSTSHQTLFESFNKHMMELDQGMALEIQKIYYKISMIEGKTNEIFDKLQELDSVLNKKEEKFDAETRENREKTVEIGQKLKFFKEDCKKLQENFEKLVKKVQSIQEKPVRTEQHPENFSALLSEVWRLFEGCKYEVWEKVNKESLKVDEKIAELHSSLERSLLSTLKGSQVLRTNSEQVESNKEVIEYFNSGLSKCYSDFGGLKSRLEKVEENDRIVLEFIKSRRG